MAIPFNADNFIALFPEFASTGTVRCALVAEQAQLYVSEGVFGASAEHALMLYTAHLLTLWNRTGGQGPVVMDKVGDLTTQYAAPMLTAKDMDSTAYGLQFSKLARRKTGTGMMQVNL